MTVRRLEGKVAIVTGAANGIGQAMTGVFVDEGATVLAADIRPEVVDVWKGNDAVMAVQTDITRSESVDEIVRTAEKDAGRLDILCNVAGIIDHLSLLDETTDEIWDRVMDINLKAPFRLCRAALPLLLTRGGSIVNIASMAATKGLPGPTYGASKAGLVGLTRSLAIAYGAKGVRCNAINPGVITTNIGMNSGGYSERGRELLMSIVKGLPVIPNGVPEDIARTALWLCSDDAKYVNGAVVAVDGGMAAA
jgi:NAD(P)-dependent dehydrogenase (short-subunit alcohol dehydrogenase family)